MMNEVDEDCDELVVVDVKNSAGAYCPPERAKASVRGGINQVLPPSFYIKEVFLTGSSIDWGAFE